MTDDVMKEERAQTIIDKMKAMFGDRFADPDHSPMQFEYQVKLAQYEIFLETPAVEVQTTEEE